MDTIWLDGRTSKEELASRLDRAERLLEPYDAEQREQLMHLLGALAGHWEGLTEAL